MVIKAATTCAVAIFSATCTLTACTGEDQTSTSTSPANTQVPYTVSKSLRPDEAESYTDNDLEQLSAESFSRLDQTIKIGFLAPKLFEWRSAARDLMISRLSSQQKDLLAGDVSDDSTTDATNKILRNFAVDLFDATSQGNKPQDKELGLKLLATVVGNENPQLPNLQRTVRDGSYIFAYQNITPPATDANIVDLYGKTLRGIHLGNEGVRVIDVIDRSQDGSGAKYSLLFDFERSNNGLGKWVYEDSYAFGDVSLFGDVQRAKRGS